MVSRKRRLLAWPVGLACAALALPAAGVSPVLAAPAGMCALAGAGWPASLCAAHSITAAEEKIIRLDEAKGGKPIPKPYPDGEGNCTIGLGHLILHNGRKGPCTEADFDYWVGQRVTEQALIELFHDDIAAREGWLNPYLGQFGLSLRPCQYDALFDLLFNGGSSWFAARKPLYKALKAKDISAIPGIIASDVPPGLSKIDKQVITARRQRDADRFRTPHCPCKFVEIFGTITAKEFQPDGQTGGFGGDTLTGIIKVDVVSTALPPGGPFEWTSAGSTYQFTDILDQGITLSGCTSTEKGNANGSGTLPYNASAIGYSTAIAAAWIPGQPPRVQFMIGAYQQETVTVMGTGTCPGSSTHTRQVGIVPYCLKDPLGFATGVFNRRNSTVVIKCSGDTNGVTYSIKGTLTVSSS